MQKYLVIIIILVILYYLHNCWVESKIEKFINSNKIREDFGDAVTVDAIDDNNAINVLAKIAKDLQEGGGLKVKGNLLVDKTIRVTGAKTTPAGSGDMMTHLNHEDGNNYLRGNTYLSGNLEISGVSTVPVEVWHKSKDGKNRVFYGNNGTTIYGSGNGRHHFRTGANGNAPEVVIDEEGTIHVSKINIGGVVIENTNEGLKINGNVRMHNNQIVMSADNCNNGYIQLNQSCGNNSISNDGNGRIWIRSDKRKSGEVIQHW